MNIKCDHCGKEFHKKKSQITKRGEYFCSKECWYEHKKRKITVACKQCGKEVEKNICNLSKKGNYFCSLPCSNKWHSRENHPYWKGGFSINKEGYVYRWDCEKKGIIEHRQIYERYLGRPLRKDERIHHINGNRSDNRLENLELWDQSHPAGQRVEDKIQWAIELLERHGYVIQKQRELSPEESKIFSQQVADLILVPVIKGFMLQKKLEDTPSAGRA